MKLRAIETRTGILKSLRPNIKPPDAPPRDPAAPRGSHCASLGQPQQKPPQQRGAASRRGEQPNLQFTSTSPGGFSPLLGSAPASSGPRVSNVEVTFQPLAWGESVPQEHGFWKGLRTTTRAARS